MKIKEIVIRRLIEAQMGALQMKKGADIMHNESRDKVFPVSRNKGFGLHTSEHFYVGIILMGIALLGLLWKPIFWFALGLYVAYNVSRYRKFDVKEE